MTHTAKRSPARGLATVGAAAISIGTLAVGGTSAFASEVAPMATQAFTDAHGDSQAGSDIHRVKVVNGKPLRIVIRHADLVPSYESSNGLKLFLDTDKSRKGPELVFLAGLFEGTDYGLLRADGWKRKNDRVVHCSHRMRLDYDKDTTRIKIGRACLDGAKQIRVAVRTAGKTTDGTMDHDWLSGRRAWTSWVARR